MFEGLPEEFQVGRYHSLFARRETFPACLEVTAESDDGVIMGVRHRELPIEAVQFHPESILTADDDHGLKLMENAVRLGKTGADRGIVYNTRREACHTLRRCGACCNSRWRSPCSRRSQQIHATDPDPKVMSFQKPDQIKWVESAAGSANAVLAGDPAKPGHVCRVDQVAPASHEPPPLPSE